jgi:adenylate kinase
MGLYIILMGVQGAGKGEQAKFIEQKYGIPQVSTGDLFRAMKTRQDELAKRVQAIMAAGNLVDDDTTNEVVVERLAKPDAAKGVILDGYPRSRGQVDFLMNHLRQKGEKINAVLLLELDLYVAFKRAFGRVKTAAGEVYNIYSRNEGLDITFEDDPNKKFPARIVAKMRSTGEVLERRPDDANAAAIIKRIDLYLAETMPLIEYFEQFGLVRRVNANQPIEAVSAGIVKILDSVK